MDYADEIRAYCRRQYVLPARAAGKKEISIRAGDVHDALGYNNKVPLVCAAIEASVFSHDSALRRINVDDPWNGANTVFRFELV